MSSHATSGAEALDWVCAIQWLVDRIMIAFHGEYLCRRPRPAAEAMGVLVETAERRKLGLVERDLLHNLPRSGKHKHDERNEQHDGSLDGPDDDLLGSVFSRTSRRARGCWACGCFNRSGAPLTATPRTRRVHNTPVRRVPER